MISLSQQQNNVLTSKVEIFLHNRCVTYNNWVIAEEVGRNIRAFAYELFSQLEGAPQKIGIPYDVSKRAFALKNGEWTLLSRIFNDCFNIRLIQKRAGFFESLFSFCSSAAKPTIIPQGVRYSFLEEQNVILAYVSLHWDENNPHIATFLQPQPPSKESAEELYSDKIANSTMPKDYSLKVGDTFYPVHSFLLGSLSEYFNRLFNNPEFREAQTKEVEIADFEAKIVKAMIDYCYTRKIPETVDQVDDLIALAKLAHRYLLTPLEKLCTVRLCSNAQNHFEKVFTHALEIEDRELITYFFKYCKKEPELQIVRQNITLGNFTLLYDLANEAAPLIKEELTLWAKYNNLIIAPNVVVQD